MNAALHASAIMALKWTALLALAWTANNLLRERHSKWRLILWRSVFCFGLAIPLMSLVGFSIIRIPIYSSPASLIEAPEISATRVSAPGNAVPATAHESAKPSVTSVTAKPVNVPPVLTGPERINGPGLLLLTWGIGAAFASFRLFRLQARLHRFRKESRPADLKIEGTARGIQAKLGVQQTIEIRVSDAVSSPFACGIRRQMILLPQKLVEEMPAAELTLLLAHEIAHFRGNDLLWCVAWRWMQALFWFHPLVWRIPAAHHLACEQEADAIADKLLHDGNSYRRLLSRLTLRVLSLPSVETQLVLNGTSQIAQRLNHLELEKTGVWTRSRSASAIAGVTTLFLIATGCEISRNKHAEANVSAAIEFKKVVVLVQDEAGEGIAGASIQPDGFRVKGRHSPDAYHWGDKAPFGPPEKVTTDRDGRAWLKYPVMGIPRENEFTGALIFSVHHPEYCTTRVQTYYVDQSNDPVRMTRGIPLDVSAWFGADRQAVTDFIPSLSESEVGLEDWQKTAGGMSFHKLSPGGHLLLLMGKLPSGEIVYSDTRAFTAEKGKRCQFAIEMKPGIRLEGRVDERVPRPVKNGRVMISVRPKEYPALTVLEDYYDIDRKYGGRYFWHSYRPINEDGTFVFESIPPGEVDVTVLGDGFASASGGQLVYRNHQTSPMPVPQPFKLAAPVTKIEVATERTATLEFTAFSKSGHKPLESVWVGMYPSVFRMSGPFGWAKKTSEEPYREVPPLPDLTFSGKTGKDGKLVLQNIPGGTRGLNAEHPKFQVPLQDPKGWRDRHLRTAFSPGITNKFELAMEPQGTDFIGSPR